MSKNGSNQSNLGLVQKTKKNKRDRDVSADSGRKPASLSDVPRCWFGGAGCR